MGLLSDEGLHPAQIFCVDGLHAAARQLHPALLHLPEPQKQLEQGGFAAARFAHNADGLARRHRHRHIPQDGLLPVAEGHLLRPGPRKGHVGLAVDVPGQRLFLQQVQHPVAGGKGVLQSGTQAGQRHHRAEGTHEGQGGQDHPGKVHRPPQIEGCGRKQHGQVKAPQDQLCGGGTPARRALEAFLPAGERLGAVLHLLQPDRPGAVLQNFRQAPQTVQHKTGQGPRLIAQPQPVGTAGPGYRQRHPDAHHGVGGQRQCPQQRVKTADESGENGAEKHRDEHRRDGVGVEHLQQFNVRGDDRDQVPFLPPFQLGGGQPTQGAEDLVPQQGQQLEGNEMVAGLLTVAQRRPQYRQHRCRHSQPGQRQGAARPQHPQDAVAAQHRQKGGAEVANQPHGDGQRHIAGQRQHQTHEPGHYGKSASLHADTSCFV